MKNKLLLILSFVLIVVVAVFAACVGPSAKETSNRQNYQIKLYFVNEEYVITGDESLAHLMPPEKVTLSSTPAEIPKAAVEALKKLPDKAHYATMLTAKITVNKVYIKGNTAYVDLARENLNGSSTQESFLISQIVQTLRNSFTAVKQVQFLVDGAVVESLMGHVETDKPLTE